MRGFDSLALILIVVGAVVLGVAILAVYWLVRLWKKRKRPGANKAKLTIQFLLIFIAFIGLYSTLILKGPLVNIRREARSFKAASSQYDVYLFNVPNYSRSRPMEHGGVFGQVYTLEKTWPADGYNIINVSEHLYEDENLYEACQASAAHDPKTICEKAKIDGIEVIYKTEVDIITSTFIMNNTYIQLSAEKNWEYPVVNYKLSNEALKEIIKSAYVYKPTLFQRVMAF